MNAESPRILISVGEIAEIAGVRSSAVSNWRTRHKDFPVEVSKGKFDRRAVIDWLRANGKEVHETEEPALDHFLWSLFDHLRANLHVAEVPAFMLQLLVLRRAREHPDDRLAPLRGYWLRLQESPASSLGDLIREASEAVEETNADLARALRPSQGVDKLPPGGMHGLLDELDSLASDADLGEVATSLLRLYSEKYGFKGGESLTAPILTQLMVDLVEPVRGTIYDPACGAALGLAEAWRRAPGVRLIGQEVNEQSWRLGYLHLLLTGADFAIRTGNTLTDDAFRDLRADRGLLDPPLGQKLTAGQEAFAGDDRWSLGLPGQHSADLLWAQQLIFHLASHGVGVMVIGPGSLSRGGAEADVRRALVQTDALDAVILLPPGLMAYTKIPVALLVLEKDRARGGGVLFIDARQLGEPQRGGHRMMAESDVARIVETVRAWRERSFSPELRFADTATAEQILRSEGDLSPQRYITYARAVAEIEGELIRPRIHRLTERLAQASPLLPERVRQARRAVGSFEELALKIATTPLRLGEILSIPPRGGTRHENEGSGEGIPFVATEVVALGPDTLTAPPAQRTYGDPGSRLTRGDDLLLLARGVDSRETVPCVRIGFDEPAAYSEGIILLRVDPSIADPDYVRLYLSSRIGAAALGAAATAGVVSHLKRDALAGVEIALPHLDVQREIAQRIAEVEHALRVVREVSSDLAAWQDALRELLVAGGGAGGAGDA